MVFPEYGNWFELSLLVVNRSEIRWYKAEFAAPSRTEARSVAQQNAAITLIVKLPVDGRMGPCIMRPSLT